MTRRRDNQFKKLNRLANQMGEILQGLSPDDLVKVGAIIEEDYPPIFVFVSCTMHPRGVAQNGEQTAYESRVARRAAQRTGRLSPYAT